MYCKGMNFFDMMKIGYREAIRLSIKGATLCVMI